MCLRVVLVYYDWFTYTHYARKGILISHRIHSMHRSRLQTSALSGGSGNAVYFCVVGIMYTPRTFYYI